jgi:hypothetical protein
LSLELVLARVDWVGLVVERADVLRGVEVEERDLPPSILDQVGGVDLVCLGGGFLAAEDWGMVTSVLRTAYRILRMNESMSLRYAVD